MSRWVIPVLVAFGSLPGAGAEESEPQLAHAVFAGGCFWCMEPPYDRLDGVVETISGYVGGSAEDATYKKVVTGRTGHYEAVRIQYDPARVDYETLLEVFWRNVDPFDATGQFCDKGPQYRAAIFPLTDRQRELAEQSRQRVAASLAGRGEIRTEILPAAPFYAAEDYHQDYYRTNSVRYKFYRWNCGRDRRLQTVWGGSVEQPLQ